MKKIYFEPCITNIVFTSEEVLGASQPDVPELPDHDWAQKRVQVFPEND